MAGRFKDMSATPHSTILATERVFDVVRNWAREAPDARRRISDLFWALRGLSKRRPIFFVGRVPAPAIGFLSSPRMISLRL